MTTQQPEALRTLAREKYGDRYDAIQRAERDTETEALNLVAAAPTTQPAPQQEAQEPVAWESTTPGYIKYITQARYEKFSPNVQRWYKPYGCSGCAERGAGFDACDMATAAAQGFRRGQAAAKQEG